MISVFLVFNCECIIIHASSIALQQGKKAEIRQKIEQVRNGVTDFTNSIEGMRITRDSKNSAMDKLQTDIKVGGRGNVNFVYKLDDEQMRGRRFATNLRVLYM